MPDTTKPTRAMLAAIGEVAAESARVEDLMRGIFARLIDSPYGDVITAGDSISNICQMCARVAQYNLTLSETHMEQLASIIKVVNELQPHRNYFVHSRWEYVRSMKKHAGIRSSRPSSKSNGADINELWYCTPDDALTIAGDFRVVGDAIERFTVETFPDWSHYRLTRRASWKRMEELFSDLLRSPASPDEADTATLATDRLT